MIKKLVIVVVLISVIGLSLSSFGNDRSIVMDNTESMFNEAIDNCNTSDLIQNNKPNARIVTPISMELSDVDNEGEADEVIYYMVSVKPLQTD